MNNPTQTTSDMTHGRIYRVALKRFLTMGFNPRSAIFNATYYATHKTSQGK